MIKKLTLLCLILFVGLVIFGCNSEILTTTTSTTTTSLYTAYDMNTVFGSDAICSMTQLNGYLYIATDAKLYKISTSNPTTVVTSIAVANSYQSMMAGNIAIGGSVALVLITFFSGVQSSQIIYYDNSLNIVNTGTDGTDVPSALTIYDSNFSFIYKNSNFYKKLFETDNPSNIYSVNETGIISLEYGNNNYFYACKPDMIYKYAYDGTIFNATPTSLAASTIDASTNLIGIAYVNPYIWVIDNTSKKLYKVLDNL